MKKFLSLVLALVMTMSLVTISAGATSFTDDDSINYDDAIEVMQALGVIDGYTDGSFRPGTALNRGQAAKIICNLILGPTTAAALPVTSAPFSDVTTDNVFAGYIAFCAKEGIINGYTDGTFRPAGQLTGYAFLKMLLGALGYDAEIEGYTGVSNWGINVAKQAIGIGLVDGNDDFAGTQTVTRQEACLYALNTLKATMVDYDSKTTVTVNGAAVVIGNSNAYDMTNYTTSDGKIEDDNKMQFAEKYFTDLKLVDSTDDFGRPANQWKIKNTVVGTFAKTPDATYTTDVKGKAIYADLGDKYAVNEYYVNGKAATPLSGFAIARNNDTKLAKNQNGTLTEVYLIDDDGDDVAVIVSIQTFLAQVSGDYDEDDGELTLTDVEDDDVAAISDVVTDSDELTLSDDDFANLDQFEDEDYVLVTVADGVIKTIAKAETVTATVTNYEDDANVTADGETREYSATYNGTEGKSDGYTIKDEYTLYLDQYGYVIFADGSEANDKYLYIADTAYASSLASKASAKANAYFLDGTNEEITINKVDGTKIEGQTQAEAITAGWYTYSEKTSGKYDLTAVGVTDDSNTSSSSKLISKDSVKFTTDDDTTYTATKNTTFLVIDEDDDVKVYTGIKNVPQIWGSGVVVSVVPEKSGSSYAKYVCIDLGDDGETKGGSSSSDVVFIYKNSYDKRGTDSDENIYYTYKSVLNGKVTKVKFDDSFDGLDVGLYTDVEYDTNGYVSDCTVIDEEGDYEMDTDAEDYSYDIGLGGVAASQKSGVVTIGSNDYYLADDAVIMVIDDGAMVTVTAKKLVSDYSGTITDVYGVLNSDSEFTYLFINTTLA